MISLTVTSVPSFTKDLFVGEIFDPYYLSEAVFHTSHLISIGSAPDALKKEEEPEDPENRTWGHVRRIAFEIVRGKKLPHSFRIALAASPEMISEVTQAEKGFFKENPELIDALILNIYYKDQKIRITTSTSLKLFSPEQPNLDKVWDQFVIAYFEMYEIGFTDDL